MIVNYPDYLQFERLPLLQPLVNESIQKAAPQLTEFARLISQYATGAKTVETKRMIQWFQNAIPSPEVTRFRLLWPCVVPCLDPISKENWPSVPEASIHLEKTPERELAAWASMFFAYRDREFRNGLEEGEEAENDSSKYFQFFNRISEVSLVESCNPKSDKRLCHTYVFGHLSWYKAPNPLGLGRPPEEVVEFLLSKGFFRGDELLVGQAVIYHNKTKTNHYAKVVRIFRGDAIVRSKLGRQNIFEHPMEVVPHHYGNSVTILNFPKKSPS